MKNLLKAMVAGAVLAINIPVHAQLVTYSFTTSNDAHTANGASEDSVSPTQSAANSISAPASNFNYNPQPATPPGKPASQDGLEPGYPFGYTVSAAAYYYPTTLATAESQGTYLTFTLTPQTGFALHLTKVDLSGVSFSSDFAGSNSQNGMPASGYIVSLTSSVDGYKEDLGDTAFNFSTAGTDITLPSQYAAVNQPVTFHLDLYGTEPNEAAFVYLTIADGGNIKVDGTSTIIPEPSTYAMLGVGVAFLLVMIRVRRNGNA